MEIKSKPYRNQFKRSGFLGVLSAVSDSPYLKVEIQHHQTDL